MKLRQLPISIVLLVVVGLAGCIKENDPNLLPGGKQSVALTAAVEGMAVEKTVSRATSANTWTGGEEVAVQIGSEVKRYTVTANGTLAAHSTNEPFYWTNTTEQKTLSAWFPHSTSQPTTFNVQADQSAAGYQGSDLIYVAPTTISYGGSQAILFKHLPSKLAVNIKAGNGVTQDEVRNATVTVLNQTLTSGTIADDWSVTKQASGNTPITSKVLGTPASGFHKSVEAIVVPQTIAAGARLLQITIGAGHFYYTPTAEQSFDAGEQRTYHITVNKSGITVTASGAQAWTGTTTNVTSNDIYKASDLKIGDYYYSDGTWSDGGLRKLYTDGTFAKEDIAPDGSKTVVGIVFKVGKDVNGSWKDDCNYTFKGTATSMPAIHGYVLGLYDANSRGIYEWGSYGTKVEHNDMNREQYTGFYGYKNTNAIKTFAADKDKTLETDFPATYYATVGYEARDPAPNNSSGWFLPSAGQCWYWYNNKDVILASVRKATGADSYNWQYFYWSSSENVIDPANNAWIVHFGIGRVGYNGKGYSNYVRGVFAF